MILQREVIPAGLRPLKVRLQGRVYALRRREGDITVHPVQLNIKRLVSEND